MPFLMIRGCPTVRRVYSDFIFANNIIEFYRVFYMHDAILEQESFVNSDTMTRKNYAGML